MSELSLVAYVHMSKWVAILMLRICYKYIFGNICVNILKITYQFCGLLRSKNI